MSTAPPEKIGEIRKWLNVLKADFTQIIALLVVIVPVIVTVIYFIFKVELDSKDAQLASKDDQIKLVERQRDDFKNKTGTSTPDEAKTKIDTLKLTR